MTWLNNDGLFVRFGKEESANARGGDVQHNTQHELVFTVKSADVQSATNVIITGDGGRGISWPKGAIAESTEITVKTPFTSSGTVGSATLVLGTIKASDRTSALDVDDFTTTSFVASVLDGAGEQTLVKPGVTGAGDAYGVANTEEGLICVANSTHSTNPYTDGEAIVRIRYRFDA